MKSKGKTEQAAAGNASGAAQGKPARPDNWRETIESVVVAFVLAFLFRTFEAEAFVIPTGSMAPTLYGQHRDVCCEMCGTRFAVGVSSGTTFESELRDGYIVPAERSNFAICPNANCRFPNDVLESEMFAGDRILVNKFPYEFAEPERWDVVVFKFPDGAKTNYIKRLAGLPGEEVKLEGGDVKVRPRGTTKEFRVARKTPEKQRPLQLLVHDNDHSARALLAAGWPEAWADDGEAAWVADAQARTFSIEPDPDQPEAVHWLRYTNYVPRADDWDLALAGKHPAPAQPALIKDFYAYNSRITVGFAAGSVRRGQLPDAPGSPTEPEQWVGDLTVNCALEVLSAEGEVTFELVEGRRLYHCRIDLATGLGTFHYTPEAGDEEDEWQPAGEPFETGMNKPGVYQVSFANVDDRLCFWVGDRLMKSLEFEEGSKFEPPPPPVAETERDRHPVAIGARLAKVRLAHLRIERDIFYRSEVGGSILPPDKTFDLKNDPDDDSKDEFLMLGDNSPRSNDSRGWQKSHAVPRHLLIGKAFFVYWPHGVPFLNDGRGYAIAKYYEEKTNGPPIPKFSVPFYPQIGRMHRIR